MSSSSLLVNPGADYFLRRNLSLGMALGYDEQKTHDVDAHGEGSDQKVTLISAGLRVGYNIPLGGRFSFYPTGMLGVASLAREVSGSVTGGFGGSTSSVLLTARADATVLFHPLPHFFLGLGPYVVRYAGTSASATNAELSQVGVGLTVGGYLRGEPEVPPPSGDEFEAAAPPKVEDTAQFGQRHSLVLSNELALGGSVTFVSGGTLGNVAIQPGVDYFVIDHLSVGAGLALSYDYANNGPATSTDALGLGAAVRVGGDLPLARYLSFWPRVSLGVGTQRSTKQDGLATSTQDVTVGGFAPILFHPSTHFFVGIGPSLVTEVARSSDNGSQLKATTIGASFIIGGWW